MNNLKKDQIKIAWAVPFPIKGGGGYRTILSRAEYLRDVCGATCDLFLIPDIIFDENKIRDILLEWFNFEAQGIYMESIIQGDYDCIVATEHGTAEYVAIQNIPHKFYLVQDYEPYFFPDNGDENIKKRAKRAERSYELGLKPIVLGRWLTNKLAVNDNDIFFSDFGANDEIYFPIDKKRENAICAIYQPEKIRREPELLESALRQIALKNPDLRIYTYGGSKSPDLDNASANHEHLGIVSPDELRSLYNSCKVGICLSSTNPSRVPFEMMACGLPVVELRGENTIHDFPDGGGALLAEPTSDGIFSAVMSLLENDTKLMRLSSEALEAMKGRTIEKENADFANAVFKIMKDSNCCSISNNRNPITSEERRALIQNYEETLETRDKIAANPILRGNSITINLSINSDDTHYSRLDCAIWHEPDQSDLQWIQGEKNGNEWTFNAKLKPNIKTDSPILFLHFYDFSNGQDFPIYLFPINFPYEYKRFKFFSTTYEETIQKNSLHASVKAKIK